MLNYTNIPVLHLVSLRDMCSLVILIVPALKHFSNLFVCSSQGLLFPRLEIKTRLGMRMHRVKKVKRARTRRRRERIIRKNRSSIPFPRTLHLNLAEEVPMEVDEVEGEVEAGEAGGMKRGRKMSQPLESQVV